MPTLRLINVVSVTRQKLLRGRLYVINVAKKRFWVTLKKSTFAKVVFLMKRGCSIKSGLSSTVFLFLYTVKDNLQLIFNGAATEKRSWSSTSSQFWTANANDARDLWNKLRPYIVMFSTLENSRKILLKVITRPWDLCTLGPWVKLCLQCDHTNWDHPDKRLSRSL